MKLIAGNDPPLKALLIGNYPGDGQESMARFLNILMQEFPKNGIEVEQIRPEPVLGRIFKGNAGAGKWAGYVDKLILFPRKLRRTLANAPAGLFTHICDHSNSVYTRELRSRPHLITCHDFIAIRSALGEFPGQRTRFTGSLYQNHILRGLNRAHHVACISDATRKDLLRLSKLDSNKASLVYNGLNYAYSQLNENTKVSGLLGVSKRLAQGKEIKPGFIFHIGSNLWYKNRIGVLQIYAEVCRRNPSAPQLVMAGKPLSVEAREMIKGERLENRVIELVSVTNAELNVLYNVAALLLFPSLQEGFGWPIVEAQAAGCPVVLMDRAPMNEIAGMAGEYFKPSPSDTRDSGFSVEEILGGAMAVERILNERQDDRARRIEAGMQNAVRYSTGEMIDAYSALYRRLAVGGSTLADSKNSVDTSSERRNSNENYCLGN